MENDAPKNERIAPANISSLGVNEIFVFGSNSKGYHSGGAALTAFKRFGAKWGQGVGLQGKTYAIPTLPHGLNSIKKYVDDFIVFAKNNPRLTFLVSRIGCGIAGYKDEQIAPFFADALNVKNIRLPEEFYTILTRTE